jgi:hypothetical protein
MTQEIEAQNRPEEPKTDKSEQNVLHFTGTPKDVVPILKIAQGIAGLHLSLVLKADSPEIFQKLLEKICKLDTTS